MTFGVIPLGRATISPQRWDSLDVEAALAAIIGGQSLAVDVGRLNERYFINVSAGGFIAGSIRRCRSDIEDTRRQAGLPDRWRPGTVQPRAVAARVRTSSGRDTNVTLTLFAVCNSRLIGGGRLIAPEASIDDGLFDVCLVEEMPTIEFLPY